MAMLLKKMKRTNAIMRNIVYPFVAAILLIHTSLSCNALKKVGQSGFESGTGGL
jgi:hypothetical protein